MSELLIVSAKGVFLRFLTREGLQGRGVYALTFKVVVWFWSKVLKEFVMCLFHSEVPIGNLHKDR